MDKKGFTLIEVLIAIIIIMILATYSVLKYTETIREGENRMAKAQLEVLAGAYTRYRMENPGKTLKGYVEGGGGTCTLTCEGCSGTTDTFNCGKIPFQQLKYIFYLGPDSENTCCSDCIATMEARPGAPVGNAFLKENGYCAYIDRFGRAVDGHIGSGS